MAKKTTYEELEQRVKELKQAECEHRQVVEALKKSRSKFQAAFEGSHDAITLTTKDGRFLDCNQRALKLYGLESKENFLEMRPSDFSPHLQPDGRVSSEALRELIDRVFQDGGFLQFEWVHQCKTGETFSAEVILTPIRLGEEEVLQASVRDITERKRAEQDLLKERTLLKAIIDNIPVMLTHYNPDANMLYLNKEFEKIVGWKTEEIRDIDLMEKVYPDPDYRQQAMEYMQKASTEWREFRVQSKSGEIIDSEWSNICMEDGTQIGIGIDITERKRAEEMLQKTQKELETIIDSVPALIAFKDKNNRYIRINKTYAEAINLPREAIEGKSAFDITQNRELAEAYWRDDKKVIESGIPKRNIIERFVADETRWIQTDKIPYRDERGNIIGIIAFFMDITPRVKAEEALRESEEKYRHLFKLSSDALFLFERETGQMLDLNEAGINMYGYTREEALQMKTADFSEEPDKTRQTIEEAETFIPVRYHRKKDGTGFSTEISICYFTWRGKEVCLASIRDITERIRTEEALKESEERYRTLVESSSDAILMIDTERKIVSCNQAFLNLFGYEKNEVEGRSIRIIHQSDGSFRFFGEVVYPEIERSGAYRTEWDLVRKDGTILPVESVTSVMKSPDGSTTGYVAIIRDISERRQTDEALRESEEKYRITLQSIPDSVCINRQKDGLYFYANEGFSQIMGYSVEEAEGKTPHDLNLFVNPADRDEFIKILNENGEVHGFELQYRKKDGTTFDALLSARPLKYGDEDCLVAVVKDITPIKEAEREKTK
ncbi:MAG: PAS domain S-box protein, partial [Deltaproteobacteria bacterium]|nr:PAS domain S-box protein [Deltaproteobacteria bacterium]